MPSSLRPENVNEEPYDEGWMIQVEPASTADIDALMSASEYQAFLKEQ